MELHFYWCAVFIWAISLTIDRLTDEDSAAHKFCQGFLTPFAIGAEFAFLLMHFVYKV